MKSVEIGELPLAKSAPAFEGAGHIAGLPAHLSRDEAVSLEHGGDLGFGYPDAIPGRDHVRLDASVTL